MKKTILFLFVIISLVACGKKEASIKKYYFPYAELVESSKIYQFVNKKDSTDVVYWEVWTNAQGSDTVFNTGIYNKNRELREVFKEQVLSTGTDVMEFSIKADSGFVKTNFKQKEVIRWNLKPKQVLFFSFSYPSEKGEQEIVKERTLESMKEEFVFDGKTYPAIRFKDFFLFNEMKDNRTITTEQYRNSFYAAGLGLVGFETFYPDGSSSYFELKRFIPQKEWESTVSRDTLH